jgi:hypothetical protein
VINTIFFTFEEWSWVAGIASVGITVIGGLISLAKKIRQSDTRAMVRAFHGVRIGASQRSLQRLKLKQIARDGEGAVKMTKWLLPEGNDLSVTYNSELDRIVYMEVDWCRKSSAKSTDLKNFRFGETSLADIRKFYKCNGFAYANRVVHEEQDEIVLFNAFELKSTPNIITVFITSISKAEHEVIRRSKQSDNIAVSCKLVAIAIADEEYLDKIWGAAKIYDPTSHAIELPLRNNLASWLTGGSR